MHPTTTAYRYYIVKYDSTYICGKKIIPYTTKKMDILVHRRINHKIYTLVCIADPWQTNLLHFCCQRRGVHFNLAVQITPGGVDSSGYLSSYSKFASQCSVRCVGKTVCNWSCNNPLFRLGMLLRSLNPIVSLI